MTYANDRPTLRITTLRTLTRHAPPLAVVHVSTPIADLEPVLADERAWVVAVDDAGVLCGVLSHDEAERALQLDHDGWVTDHMARGSVTLDAECEIAEAYAAVLAGNADHVLVISPQGELLGVVLAGVLASYRRAA